MTTSTARIENDTLAPEVVKQRNDQRGNNGHDDSFQKTVATDPKPQSWMIVATGAVIPLGLAVAATTAGYINPNERVAIAAWVAVAVVGTASVISAAAVSQRRNVSIDHDHRGTKSAEGSINRSKA